MRQATHARRALLAAALAMAGGCVGSPAPSAGSSSEDLLIDEGNLGAIEADDWEDAEAGCEGQIDGTVHFAIASAEFGLIAVVEADGDVLCVDTVSAVEEELEERGLNEEASQLVSAFHAAIGRGTGDRMLGGRAGDPDPEPNLGFRRIVLRGDPDPEPNAAP